MITINNRLEGMRERANAAGKRAGPRRKPHAPSRPIDWSRDVDSVKFDAVFEEIRAKLELQEGRQRSRSIRAAKAFRDTLRALMLDLYVARKSSRRMQLGISLDKNAYNPSDRHHRMVCFYQGVSLSYQSVRDVHKGLEACGYLTTERIGHFDRETNKGRRTRIKATEKLISTLDNRAHLTLWAIRQREGCEEIVLKDDNKDIITYQHNSFTRCSSKNLSKINNFLSNTLIDLYITDEEHKELNKRQIQRNREDDQIPASVDFSARTLRRIFNNSRWEDGGRFYGGWWQSIPRDYRKYIHINDKRTVELDYSGMHPAMLYAKVGAHLPEDPYDMGLDKVGRNFKKTAFNALVNAKGNRINKEECYDEEKSGVTWKELLAVIREYHHPIREYFNSGYGVNLQRKDSDIAEQIMLKFTDMGYACLPVHDSFIVHYALVEELQTHMENAYEEQVGLPAKVDDKSIFTYQASSNTQFVDMEDIEDMFSGGEYKGYETRRTEWYER